MHDAYRTLIINKEKTNPKKQKKKLFSLRRRRLATNNWQPQSLCSVNWSPKIPSTFIILKKKWLNYPGDRDFVGVNLIFWHERWVWLHSCAPGWWSWRRFFQKPKPRSGAGGAMTMILNPTDNAGFKDKQTRVSIII